MAAINLTLDIPCENKEGVNISVLREELISFAKILLASPSVVIRNSFTNKESLQSDISLDKKEAANAIDSFFGGWSDDPRSVDEIKESVRKSRTTNSFCK